MIWFVQKALLFMEDLLFIWSTLFQQFPEIRNGKMELSCLLLFVVFFLRVLQVYFLTVAAEKMGGDGVGDIDL